MLIVSVRAGVSTTLRVTVLYSAGTSIRHIISPVELLICSIGPRPFFQTVCAALTKTLSVSVL
ncbi:hypothetical protein BMETH_2233_0 [methanotrophic bacterial endosymbiont of Bathymodiolus sp.]|nr:hypothetical protein BMETH_2233_0 [methanotrophic bacterial endosymbiont of Bathymodiolus sp.]